jgi:hypothetical protein
MMIEHWLMMLRGDCGCLGVGVIADRRINYFKVMPVISLHLPAYGGGTRDAYNSLDTW